MKFNALQKYLLKVYAITILVLTVIVPSGLHLIILYLWKTTTM